MLLRVVVLALLSVTSALVTGVPATAVSRSAVSMNTQYSDPYAFQKKKNAKSGRGELLKGYTVGSMAPPMAVKSGSTIAEMGTSYGISARLGGRINGKKVSAVDEAPKDGKAENAALVFSVLSIATLFFANAPSPQ